MSVVSRIVNSCVRRITNKSVCLQNIEQAIIVIVIVVYVVEVGRVTHINSACNKEVNRN